MAVMGVKTKCSTPTGDPWPFNTYTMSPDCGSGGGIATNGVINNIKRSGQYHPSTIKMKDVTDGSTHTAMIGEICGSSVRSGFGQSAPPQTHKMIRLFL